MPPNISLKKDVNKRIKSEIYIAVPLYKCPPLMGLLIMKFDYTKPDNLTPFHRIAPSEESSE